MASGAAKAALFDALASVAQALGSGRRAEIVDVLAQGERSVDEIAARSRRASRTRRSTCRCSRAPGSFARAGRGRGSSTGSRASGSAICGRRCATSPSRHVAEVSVLADEYLGERDGVEQVSAAELQQRLARGEVVVLDVRPGARVPGRAHSRCALGAAARSSSRSRRSCRGGGEIVAYCRGPYCVYADDAVRLLARARSEGAPARRRLPGVAPGRLPGRDAG